MIFLSSYKIPPAKIISINVEGFALSVQNKVFQGHMDICVFLPLSLIIFAFAAAFFCSSRPRRAWNEAVAPDSP